MVSTAVVIVIVAVLVVLAVVLFSRWGEVLVGAVFGPDGLFACCCPCLRRRNPATAYAPTDDEWDKQSLVGSEDGGGEPSGDAAAGFGVSQPMFTPAGKSPVVSTPDTRAAAAAAAATALKRKEQQEAEQRRLLEEKRRPRHAAGTVAVAMPAPSSVTTSSMADPSSPKLRGGPGSALYHADAEDGEGDAQRVYTAPETPPRAADAADDEFGSPVGSPPARALP